MLVCSEF
jgi:WASH complex subunit strumpellin